jgi:hypothetical protein
VVLQSIADQIYLGIRIHPTDQSLRIHTQLERKKTEFIHSSARGSPAGKSRGPGPKSRRRIPDLVKTAWWRPGGVGGGSRRGGGQAARGRIPAGVGRFTVPFQWRGGGGAAAGRAGLRGAVQCVRGRGAAAGAGRAVRPRRRAQWRPKRCGGGGATEGDGDDDGRGEMIY